tara:strand:- start:174 stop:1034 length:861 start_codon:yes stop_codon:yes gene_type:complete
VPIKDFFLAISVPCLWGFGLVISKPGMEQLPPLLINGLRWFIAGLVLVWWFPFPKKFFKEILLVSFVACTLQYGLTYTGVSLIEASSAVLLVQSEVPFGVLVAYFLLKEKPPLKNIIGLLIAFSGLIVLTGSPSLEGKYLGVLFVLSGALTWAFGQILAKPISEKVSGWTLTAWIGVLGGPQLIISSYFIEGNTIEHIKSTTMVGWSIVLYLALVMTALGYSIWYYVLGRYPVNKVMPVHLLLPVTGVITAILLLKEKPSAEVFIGGLIIVLGVGLILIGKENQKQ